MFRVPVEGKPVTIFDTSGVPTEILNVVVSMLCRLTFDFALWSDRAVPILLVCEEAHRYAPSNDKLGFEPTKRAIARIALEGRKYGVSLGLVTQRPSELAANILSQCNTIFAHAHHQQQGPRVSGVRHAGIRQRHAGGAAGLARGRSDRDRRRRAGAAAHHVRSAAGRLPSAQQHGASSAMPGITTTSRPTS